MSERTERLYEWTRAGRRHILRLYTYYPDSEVSKGPYCVGWHRIPYKQIAQCQKTLESGGYAEYSVNHAIHTA